MKAKRLILALIAMVFTASSALAEIKSGWCGDNASWTLDTETGLLKIKGTGEMSFSSYYAPWNSSSSYITKVEIADGITSIGNRAFQNCSALTSVTIPNSVTSIEDYAFWYCYSLSSISIPNSVTSIGNNAFHSCSSLTSVTIPNSVTSIEDYAFSGCESLTSITIPNSVKTIGKGAFSGLFGRTVYISDLQAWCNIEFSDESANPVGYNGKLFLNNRLITDLVIPESVTKIGDYAFTWCKDITSVTIPHSVISIGDWAFQYCFGLTSVTIPNSVTSIGNYAFHMTSLTSVTIPGSTTKIGNNAFEYCPRLNSVTILNSVTSIGDNTFADCNALISLTIPNSVTNIGKSAFKGCSSLPSITIPNSVTSIGSEAFSGCYFISENFKNMSNCTSSNNWGATLCDVEQEDGLMIKNNVAVKCRPWATSVTIPNYINNIGDNAFYSCARLTSVTIPNSVISIGNGAFSGCHLISITIPNSVIKIGDNAFSYCSRLTSVVIPKSVTSIGNKAFAGCYFALANFKNMSGCTSDNYWGATLCDIEQEDGLIIKDNIALSCRSWATNVTIPVHVTRIEKDAFSSCYGLTSVTIPNSVTSIGDYAFANCSDLTSIAIPNSVTSIGDNAFQSCSGLTSITIPNSVISIEFSAFAFCSALTSVTIGSSVTSINSSVFQGCPNVSELIYADGCSTALRTYLTNITSVSIPESVTIIDNSAFSGCSGLTTVYIPNSVTSIGNNAFLNCSGLSSVTMGNSVTNIGSNAFNGCRLRAVRAKALLPLKIPSETFTAQTYAHAILYVPEGSWLDYCYDDVWYKFNDIREEVSTVEDAKPEDVYMLMNSKTMSYVVYDAVNNRFAEVSSVTKEDESNLNNNWMAASVDGQMYLYNMGAGRFVRPTANGFELVEGKIALDAENGKEGILLQGNSQQWSLVKNENMFPKDDVVDAITLTPSTESPETYDLQGRKMKNARNGLFIQNGRVVLMK